MILQAVALHGGGGRRTGSVEIAPCARRRNSSPCDEEDGPHWIKPPTRAPLSDPPMGGYRITTSSARAHCRLRATVEKQGQKQKCFVHNCYQVTSVNGEAAWLLTLAEASCMNATVNSLSAIFPWRPRRRARELPDGWWPLSWKTSLAAFFLDEALDAVTPRLLDPICHPRAHATCDPPTVVPAGDQIAASPSRRLVDPSTHLCLQSVRPPPLLLCLFSLVHFLLDGTAPPTYPHVAATHTSGGPGADQAVAGRAPVVAVGAAGWTDMCGGKVPATGGGASPTVGEALVRAPTARRCTRRAGRAPTRPSPAVRPWTRWCRRDGWAMGERHGCHRR